MEEFPAGNRGSGPHCHLYVSHISAEMADPREHKEEMMNLICGPTEEVYHDDREGGENPKGIDDCSQYLVDPNEQDNASQQVCNMTVSFVFTDIIRNNILY